MTSADLDQLINSNAALLRAGQVGEAIAALCRAVAVAPQNSALRFLLGEALSQAGEVAAARGCFEEVVRMDPNHGPALHALAGIHRRNLGDMQASADYSRLAMQADPAADAYHSGLLMTMHYRFDWSPEEVAAEHRAWGRAHGRQPLVSLPPPAPLPGRKLRVGYVSADFRMHPVAYFIEAMLRHHDRQTHEIFCYGDVEKPDATTRLFAQLADHWRGIERLNDAQVADLIQADRIDILVDLAGHSGKNRLKVFARRPAPVQVTYLGYPDTTGLATMDYRLVDALTDPEEAADERHTEQLVRLPGCFLCYTPHADAPPVGPPPCIKNGFVTFGSFNNFSKISPEWVAQVALVLAQVPGSRLLLKSPFAKSNDGGRARLLGAFASAGIAAERITVLPFDADHVAHLARYGEVDIALDTFPYHGTTTTCEALWMGVPVVSLAGATHVSRVGASLLHEVGLDEWSVNTPDDFVRSAAALAGQPERLAGLRQGMRERMRALTDGASFADRVERAYGGMWQAA